MSIVNKKTPTEEVEDVLARGFQGENITAMLGSLSPHCLNLWGDMLREFGKDGDSELLKQLYVAHYEKTPPSIKDFLEDPYYLGALTVKSLDSEGTFPAWKEIFIQDFNYDSTIHNCVFTGSLGIGKCWSESDELVMYDGTLKKASKIEVGDILMGDDSTPRTVTSTTRGQGLMYEIYPLKGEPFTVNADHILVLKSTQSATVTEVTVADFLAWPREKRHKACLYRVKVEWKEQPLPVPPYIMGLWLGEGHTHQTALTTADQEIADAWLSYGKSLGLTARHKTAGKGAKAVTLQLSYLDQSGVLRKGKNKLRNLLQSLGLGMNDTVTEKFIPQAYLANNRQNRLELLAGLIDTDGSKVKPSRSNPRKNEGCYEITFKIKKLADQTRFLAQSLGYFARTKVSIVNSTGYYKTHISGAYDIPVRLQRKKSQPKSLSGPISNLTGHAVYWNNCKTRFAIIPIGEPKNYYGFTLTGNGRCLMRDFTVTHNTQSMVTILLYRLLLATLLRNPHNFFGLTKGTKIIFNLLSITKAAVTETAFGDAMNFMGNSPYFIEECKYIPDQQYTNFRIPLKGSIMLTAGSRGQHLLGRNIIAVGLDEGNYRLEAEPDTKAYELYNEVRNRINNRFRKVPGYLPAISILASSAKDESSFTETIINDITKANDPGTQKVYRNSVYKIKRHTLKLGPRWFKVAYGLKNIAPMILKGWYSEQGAPITPGENTHEEAPGGASAELVPEMYFDEFRRRPLNALRDVCGISTGGVNRWFASMVDFERCFSGDTKAITYSGVLPIKTIVGKKSMLLSQPIGNSGYCHPKWVEAEIKSFGKQRLWKLTFQRNKIEKIIYSTAEHRWFVWNSRKYRPKLKEVLTMDLSPGHAIPAVYARRVLFRSESLKGVALSPYGVAHGIVFGDGYLGNRSGLASIQPARVILFGEKDAQLINWFPKNIQTKEVTVCSKLGATEGLKINDLPRYFKEFPPCNESPPYLLGWLAGYFAADGQVDEKGAGSLASADRRNLEFAEMLCQRFGIRTTEISKTERKGCCDTARPLYTLRFHVGALPNDFFLIQAHRLRNKPRNKEAQCWEVKNVEPTNQEENVYCAVVPETGSFVIEGNILTGNCVEMAEKDGIECPVIGNTELLPLSMEDDKQLWNYLDHKKFCIRVQSQPIPKRHPGSLRYAHIDLATTSMAGLAICHLVGTQLIENLLKDGMPFSEYRLVVEYDFIMTIIAGQVKPISLEKIQNFIMWLRQECGFNFGLITYDQFQCLTGDTLINTDRGLIELASVKTGDVVQSHTGPKRVKKVYKYKQVPVVRITTKRGDSICGTPNHRIAADCNSKPWRPLAFSWTRLDALKPGDVLFMRETPVEFDCKDARMVDPRSNVYQDKSMLDWPFPTRITASLAQLIGLYWGDGHVTSSHGINITAHPEDLNDLIDFLAEIGLPVKFDKHEDRECYSVKIFCARFGDWLVKNGLSKGTCKGKNGPDLPIPSKILQSSKRVKASFLRGLFSADGSVDLNDGTVSLSTCHHKLARDTMILLRTEFGIKSTLIRSYRKGFGKMRLQYVVRLRGHREDFFKKIKFCYKRKMLELAQHIHRPGRTARERIKTIEYAVADVFDLKVEESHSYVANGFLSHNSDQQLQMLEARGFKVDKQSVDRNKDAYIAWRMAIEELRLRPYRHQHMMKEAERLLDGEKKVDHPQPNGSKDTTDAAAGAYHSAINSEEKASMMVPNNPRIIPNREFESLIFEKPPIEINLPPGYTRIKTFKV